MKHLAWIGLIDASAAQLASAQAWRDDTLLPLVAALPGVEKSRLYAAFNATQLAVVAQLSAGSAPRAVASPPRPANMQFRQDLAELSYEMLQPGTRKQDDDAILYSVRFTVPNNWTEEFDRWYEEEHIPMIYGCKHWSMTRRYRVIEPGPGGPTHLALHYLSDARGFDAPELKASRVTPWRNKFLGQHWFTNVEKMIYFRQSLPSGTTPDRRVGGLNG